MQPYKFKGLCSSVKVYIEEFIRRIKKAPRVSELLSAIDGFYKTWKLCGLKKPTGLQTTSVITRNQQNDFSLEKSRLYPKFLGF